MPVRSMRYAIRLRSAQLVSSVTAAPSAAVRLQQPQPGSSWGTPERRATADPAAPRRPPRSSQRAAFPRRPARRAFTPPPMTASRPGTSLAAAASRLVHGAASRSPVMSGTSALLPVATTTACRAVSVVVAPSPPVTSTTRSELILPRPRCSAIPAESSHDTCPSSVQFEAKESRRRNTAATSSSPVTASRRAARSAVAPRSNALVGMHAQYEHSPPTSSRSMTAAVRPPRTTRSAMSPRPAPRRSR
jgi:hypothetical protein